MTRQVKILLGVILLLIFCCQSERTNVEFVLVEAYNSKFLMDSEKYAPYDYYVGNNIILPENSDKIYYHSARLMCGTGWQVTDPPMPIDFQKNPLIQFNSVDEFSDFFNAHSSSPRLVMFISDSDTIRSENYFKLLKSLQGAEDTFVVARRKITRDESEAIANSNIRRASN